MYYSPHMFVAARFLETDNHFTMPIYVCVYICIRMCVNARIRMSICIGMRICIYMRICMCIGICIHIRTCTCTCMTISGTMTTTPSRLEPRQRQPHFRQPSPFRAWRCIARQYVAARHCRHRLPRHDVFV